MLDRGVVGLFARVHRIGRGRSTRSAWATAAVNWSANATTTRERNRRAPVCAPYSRIVPALATIVAALAGGVGVGCFPNFPAISDDGQFVAVAQLSDTGGFIAESLPESSHRDLYVFTTNGANVARLTDFGIGEVGFPTFWQGAAQEGEALPPTQLAFVGRLNSPYAAAGTRDHLYLIPDAREALRDLPNFETSSRDQADGLRISPAADPGWMQPWRPRRIYSAASPDATILFPTFSPDGTKLAFIETMQRPNRLPSRRSGDQYIYDAQHFYKSSFVGRLVVLDLTDRAPGMLRDKPIIGMPRRVYERDNVVPQVAWRDDNTLVFLEWLGADTNDKPDAWTFACEARLVKRPLVGEDGALPVDVELWRGIASRYLITIAVDHDSGRIAFDRSPDPLFGAPGAILVIDGEHGIDAAQPAAAIEIATGDSEEKATAWRPFFDGADRIVFWQGRVYSSNGKHRAFERRIVADGDTNHVEWVEVDAPPIEYERRVERVFPLSSDAVAVGGRTLKPDELRAGLNGGAALVPDRQVDTLRLYRTNGTQQNLDTRAVDLVQQRAPNASVVIARARAAMGREGSRPRIRNTVLALNVDYYDRAENGDVKVRNGFYNELYTAPARGEPAQLRVEEDFLDETVTTWDGEVIRKADGQRFTEYDPTNGFGQQLPVAREEGRRLLYQIRLRQVLMLEGVDRTANEDGTIYVDVGFAGFKVARVRDPLTGQTIERHYMQVRRREVIRDPFDAAATPGQQDFVLFFDVKNAPTYQLRQAWIESRGWMVRKPEGESDASARAIMTLVFSDFRGIRSSLPGEPELQLAHRMDSYSGGHYLDITELHQRVLQFRGTVLGSGVKKPYGYAKDARVFEGTIWTGYNLPLPASAFTDLYWR